MASGAVYDIPITGGSANATFTSAATQAQTINYSPIFDLGSGGTLTASPSQTASETASATDPNSLAAYPAGAGLATLGTAYPGSPAAAAAAPLAISSTTMLLLLGAVALVLLMPSGGRK